MYLIATLSCGGLLAGKDVSYTMDFPEPQGSGVELLKDSKCRFNGGSSEGWGVVMEVDETLQIFRVNRLSWDILSTQGDRVGRLFWVAVKELKLKSLRLSPPTQWRRKHESLNAKP